MHVSTTYNYSVTITSLVELIIVCSSPIPKSKHAATLPASYIHAWMTITYILKGSLHKEECVTFTPGLI